MNFLADKFIEMAFINVKIMEKFPDAAPFGVGIEIFPDRIASGNFIRANPGTRIFTFPKIGKNTSSLCIGCIFNTKKTSRGLEIAQRNILKNLLSDLI